MSSNPWKTLIAEVANILQGSAFVREGNSFVDASNPEALKKIELEKFRWNTPHEKKFSLNLEVAVCDTRLETASTPSSTGRCSPVFRKNAGYLWGDEAFLYVLPATFPPEQFTAELRRHLHDYVLPFFKRCDSVDGVMATLNEENRKLGRNFFSASMAVALARLGRLKESRKYFLESIGEPETIRKVAGTYGISLDG